MVGNETFPPRPFPPPQNQKKTGPPGISIPRSPPVWSSLPAAFPDAPLRPAKPATPSLFPPLLPSFLFFFAYPHPLGPFVSFFPPFWPRTRVQGVVFLQKKPDGRNGAPRSKNPVIKFPPLFFFFGLFFPAQKADPKRWYRPSRGRRRSSPGPPPKPPGPIRPCTRNFSPRQPPTPPPLAAVAQNPALK